MTAADLSVEELTAWMRMPMILLDWAKQAAAPARLVREALLGIYTVAPVGVWWDSAAEKLAVCRDDQAATDDDLQRVKTALAEVAPVHIHPSHGDPATSIKLGYSPTIRRVGELLNFFPGKWPGGIPNHPGPVGSMLTSGLVGAGLGYGVGTLGGSLLPDSWDKKKLGRTLAVLGGAVGAASGVAWGGVNKSLGLPFNSNRLLYHRADEAPFPPLEVTALDQKFAAVPLGSKFQAACTQYGQQLGAQFETAIKDAGYDGFAEGPMPGVDVDALGRTLWETGANPQLSATTMGAVMAAGQLPGGDDPGWVTPMQMAELSARMGAGYLSGAIVGKTLGMLTGMPEKAQNKLRQTGVLMAIVGSVIPKLFGR